MKNNQKLTMTDLEEIFNKAIQFNEKYIGVKIKMVNMDEPEIIINPRDNFEEKLEYYKKSYNNDLILKACKDIKITNFIYGESFAEIQDLLCY